MFHEGYIQKDLLVWGVCWDQPSPLSGGRHVDRLHSFCGDQGDIRFMGLVFNSSSTGENIFASAYPFAVRGTSHQIEIEAVTPWDYGLEGVIEGRTTFGSEISFFDPLFFINKHRYQRGRSYEFILSGLTYLIEKPGTDELAINEGEFYEMAVADGTVKGGAPLKISTSGMAALFPRDDLGLGEFEFHSPVRVVRTTKFDGFPIHVMQATVQRSLDDDQNFDITLYAAQSSLRPGLKFEGETDVSGLMWLQGYLAGSL